MELAWKINKLLSVLSSIFGFQHEIFLSCKDRHSPDVWGAMICGYCKKWKSFGKRANLDNWKRKQNMA